LIADIKALPGHQGAGGQAGAPLTSLA
jgi:hypothetical protein